MHEETTVSVQVLGTMWNTRTARTVVMHWERCASRRSYLNCKLAGHVERVRVLRLSKVFQLWASFTAHKCLQREIHTAVRAVLYSKSTQGLPRHLLSTVQHLFNDYDLGV